jgi:hypothetical protein
MQVAATQPCLMSAGQEFLKEKNRRGSKCSGARIEVPIVRKPPHHEVLNHQLSIRNTYK